MTPSTLLLILTLIPIGIFCTTNSDVGLSTPEMIENHGYLAETHYITTEDGYIITYHRIPHGLTNNDTVMKRPPVLVMHGLQGCSANYVQLGTTRGLAYLLSDAGYDVWLGNARGNHYSRNHTSLDPVLDAEKYFDFSWHELGYYDLASAIDYILSVNGDDSLFYVGTSQGTTAFLALATSRPEYNKKIKLASLMAPAGIMGNRDDVLGVFCKYIDEVEHLLRKYQWYEFPLIDQIRAAAPVFCSDPDNIDLCKAIYALIISSEEDAEFDKDLLMTIFTNTPSNSAIKQYIHYGQIIKNGGFSYFDYGTETNLEVYGTETPPSYDISKIAAPVAIYYAKNDGLVPYNDNLELISKLPNVVNAYLVPSDYFNHMSFGVARDLVNLVFNELLDDMKEVRDQ